MTVKVCGLQTRCNAAWVLESIVLSTLSYNLNYDKIT